MNTIQPIYYFEMLKKLFQNYDKLLKFMKKTSLKWKGLDFLMDLFLFIVIFGISFVIVYFVAYITIYTKLGISFLISLIVLIIHKCKISKIAKSCLEVNEHTKEVDIDENVLNKIGLKVNDKETIKVDENKKPKTKNVITLFSYNIMTKMANFMNVIVKNNNILANVEYCIKAMFIIIYLNLKEFNEKLDELEKYVEQNSPKAFVELYYNSKAQLKRISKFVFSEDADLDSMTVFDCAMYTSLTKHMMDNQEDYTRVINTLCENINNVQSHDCTDKFAQKVSDIINSNGEEYEKYIKYYYN